MNIYNDDGTKRPAPNTDKIRLGQRIEAQEARAGESSPRRLLAERAIEVIRSSTSIDDMRERADRANCTIVIEDKIGKDGKLRYSGFVKADDGTGLRVNLYALPKDCAAYAIMKRFEEKPEGKPAKVKAWTANSARSAARKIFNSSSSLDEAEAKLAAKGMSIEKQGKTGGYLRFAEGDEGRIKLSALGGKYSLSALHKRFNASSTAHASSMHESQRTVNASSRKDASKDASEVQADRVTTAAERAEATEDKAAAASAAAVQAGAEAADDFYSLDFFEQISVLQRVAGVEAAARAATARWADAEERAQELEIRAKAAEMALSMSQHTENTQFNDKKEKKMDRHFDPKKYDYNAARAAAMLACHALAEDRDYGFAAHQLEKADQALSRVARRNYEIAPGADVSALLDAASRLYELCDDVHEQSVVSEADDAKIVAALDKVIEEHAKVAPGAPTSIDTNNSEKTDAGFGKAPTETGPKNEKTAQALQEKENQPARRKFSFGSMLGKKFGGTSSGPAGGPKM